MNWIYPLRALIFIQALILMPVFPCCAREKETTSAPSKELIEFLGEFTDDDVGWVDPFYLLVLEKANPEKMMDKGDNDAEQ